ncbi:MAG: hypothetical protein IPG72_11970 [Ardenticatenales bacterium]|nr:hypothetical protein [Ardenticatenales bacterium]
MPSRRPSTLAPHTAIVVSVFILALAAPGCAVIPADATPEAPPGPRSHASVASDAAADVPADVAANVAANVESDVAADAPWIAAPVGQFGGGIQAMAADTERGIVWVGIGPRVAALDVSDPAAPTVVGRTALMAGAVTGMAVQGTTGVALGWARATTDDTFHVLDLHEPTAPQVVGGLSLPGTMVSVAIGHGHAYALRDTTDPDTFIRRFRLVAVDIRDPQQPRLVNDDVVSGADDVVDVQVKGDVLAVTVRHTRSEADPTDRYLLHLLRLTDPAAPTAVQVIADAAWCRLADGPGADVDGMLYGHGYRGGIVALDVSVPESPREVRRWSAAESGDSTCGPVDVAPFLVDAAGSPFLTTFDEHDRRGNRLTAVDAPPDARGRRPSHFFDIWAQAAALVGPHAVMAEASGDITVLDTRAMTAAEGAADVVGQLAQLGWTTTIAVREDFDDGMLYAATVVGGLTMLSLDTPLNPPVAGRLVDGRHQRYSLHVAGGMAAIGRGRQATDPGQPDVHEAEVIDVTDPTTPRPRAVFGGGRFARLLTTNSGPSIVHGPSGVFGEGPAPVLSGVDDPPSRAGTSVPIDMRLLDGVTVGERFVAVGSAPSAPSARCTTKRLSLWNLADSRQPRLESKLDLGACSNEPNRLVVAATDRVAFVGAALDWTEWPEVGHSRLTVVAIDDRSTLRVLAQLPIVGTVNNLTEHDGFVYAGTSGCLADGRGCVVVVDAHDPSAPRIVGLLDAGSAGERDTVAVRGGRVYVASDTNGVMVFEPPLAWRRPRGEAWVALPWVDRQAGD